MRGAAVSVLLALTLLINLSSGLHAAEAGEKPLIVPLQGLIAFDSETLKPRWLASIGETVQRPVSTTEIIIVSNSSGVTAIEPDTGAVRWRLTDSSDMFSAVVDGNMAYLASKNGSLQAVGLDKGDELWRKRFTGWVYPPAVSVSRLYTGGSAAKLWALDRDDGKLQWERDLGQEMVYSPVVTPDGDIIVTTFAREVLAFSPAGIRLWRIKLPAVVTSPVVLHERLVFNGLDNSLYAINGRNGELLWSRALDERLQTPMVVDRDAVIVLLENGRLASVNGRTGESREIYSVSGESLTPPYLRGDRIILFLRSFQGPEIVNIPRRSGEPSIQEI